ncbi:MAG: DUF4157 domain-containing protein [Bacteroidetes bacterium]|nr:DUF4157 domain-containing protein [Bacteroidota bacterium]
MYRGDYLDRLERVVLERAEEALKGTVWTAQGCPWIAYWFGYYRSQNAAHLERAIHRYIPDAAAADTAERYVELVAARIERGLVRFARTGSLGDIPNGAPRSLPAGVSWNDIIDSADGRRSDYLARLERMRSETPAAAAALETLGAGAVAGESRNHLEQVRKQLGEGEPLPADVRSRMSEALGEDVGDARIHTDSRSAALAAREDARAFTVGRDVVFGAGEYRPGTLAGEGLIAHELAHVLQQRDAEAEEPAATDSVEHDAERSTRGALVRSLARGLRGFRGLMEGVRENAKPALKSGLQLARCVRENSPAVPGKSDAEIEHLFETLTGERYDRIEKALIDPNDIQNQEEQLKAALREAGFNDYQDLDRQRDRFLALFQMHAVATAREMLDASEKIVRSELQRYSSTSGFVDIYNALDPLRNKLGETIDRGERDDDKRGLQPGTLYVTWKFTKWDAAKEEGREIMDKLQDKFPILADETIDPVMLVPNPNNTTEKKVDAVENAGAHLALKPVEFVEEVKYSTRTYEPQQYLRDVANERLDDIAKTRKNLDDSPEMIWTLEPVMATTMKRYGISSQSAAGMILEAKMRRVRIAGIFKAIGTIALTAIAVILTRGVGLTALLGRLGLTAISVASVVDEYVDYQRNSAAAGTAFDPSQALRKERPEIAWLVIGIFGAVADVAASIRSVRMLLAQRLVERLEEAGKAVNAGTKSADEFANEVEEVVPQVKEEVKVELQSAGVDEKEVKEALEVDPKKVAESVKQQASTVKAAGQSTERLWAPGKVLENLSDASKQQIIDEIRSAFGSKSLRQSQLRSALARFKNRYYKVGGNNYLLAKSDLEHILERHHPRYWDESFKKLQTFLDPQMTTGDIGDIVNEVMKQNREELLKRSPIEFFSIKGTYNGIEYTVGFNSGHIGQFY